MEGGLTSMETDLTSMETDLRGSGSFSRLKLQQDDLISLFPREALQAKLPMRSQKPRMRLTPRRSGTVPEALSHLARRAHAP